MRRHPSSQFHLPFCPLFFLLSINSLVANNYVPETTADVYFPGSTALGPPGKRAVV